MDPRNGEQESHAALRRMSGMEKTVVVLLLSAAIAGVLVFTIGQGKIRRIDPASPPVREQAVVPPDPMEPHALAALEAFFEAPDFESKARHVRDASRVLPMMEDYHLRRGHPFPTLSRISKGQVAESAGFPMVLFAVEPFSGPRYPVAVAWDGRRFAVDWESLTAYGTIDWDEFIERKPVAKHTLRVYIRAARETDLIPNAPPGNETFRIEHRDDPRPIIAMAGQEIAATLAPLVVRSRVPVTLDLEWRPLGPGGALVPEIVRMVANGWSR